MIEPCPFCGGDVRFDLGDLSAKCPSCFYTGPTDDNEAAAHNSLSRLVRAAEDWNEYFVQNMYVSVEKCIKLSNAVWRKSKCS